MAGVYKFTITAVDRATEVARRIRGAYSNLGKPFTDLGKSVSSFSKESGLSKLAKNVGTVGKAFGQAASKAGGFAPELETIIGLGGKGGAAGVFVGLAAAIGVMTVKWANFGFDIKQTSNYLGVSTKALQAWRGAAEEMGVDAKAADNTLMGVADTLQDAFAGRNNNALFLFQRLGLQLKRTKTGAVDVNDELIQLSGVLQRFKGNPSIQRLVASTFGIDPQMIRVLGQGPAATRAFLNDASKYALTDREVDDANKADLFFKRMGVHFKTGLYKVFAGGASFVGKAFRFPLSGAGLLTASSGPLGLLVARLDRLSGSVDGLLKFMRDVWASITELTRGFVGWAKSAIEQFKSSPLVQGAEAGADLARGNWTAQNVDKLLGTFGIKRNNPGNIRPVGGGGFNTYATLGQGVTAMARQLQIYQDKHRLNTIAGIVNRWAPPSDHNNTAAYIANVARWTGFGAGQALNLHDPAVLARLTSAMIRQEQGRAVLSPEQVQRAIGGGGPRILGAGAYGGSLGGQATVDVTVRHDGASAHVTTKSSGGVQARGRVVQSMPGVPA